MTNTTCYKNKLRRLWLAGLHVKKGGDGNIQALEEHLKFLVRGMNYMLGKEVVTNTINYESTLWLGSCSITALRIPYVYFSVGSPVEDDKVKNLSASYMCNCK